MPYKALPSITDVGCLPGQRRRVHRRPAPARAARFTWLWLVLVLAGCASTGEPTVEETSKAAAEAVEPPPASAALPAEVARALLPPLPAASRQPAGDDSSADRFDLRVDEMPARVFFASLVSDTPHNLVVHPQVEGRISLQLKSVTVPEVLEIVRTVYGYDYQHTATGYVVMPAGLQTRVFHVDYLHVKREGQSRTRISSGQVTDNPAALGNRNGATGVVGGFGGGAGGEAYQASASGRIETESRSEFWQSLENSLKMIVGQNDGRQVVISPDAGLLVVRAPAAELRQVEEFLSRLQANLVRQVVLEAKILEVRLNDRYQAGVNWAAVADNDGRTLFGGTIGGSDVFEQGSSAIGGSPLAVSPGNPVTGFASSAIGGAFALAVDASDFNAVIELLDDQGDVKVLSSPRVATVNNQKAIIKVGTDEFFVTGVQSLATIGTTATTNQNIELTPFFSGVALDVTPQVSANGEVILHVHPMVSEVTDQTKNLIVAGEQQQFPLALSNVRETDSVIRAQSGQVVVIGGLMQENKENREFSTPLLGDLPVIGSLFRQTRQISEKSELVILLKPTVVDQPEAWAGEVRDAGRRLRRLEPDLEWPPGS